MKKRSSKKLDLDSLELLAKKMIDQGPEERPKLVSRTSMNPNQTRSSWKEKLAGMPYKEKMILSKM